MISSAELWNQLRESAHVQLDRWLDRLFEQIPDPESGEGFEIGFSGARVCEHSDGGSVFAIVVERKELEGL